MYDPRNLMQKSPNVISAALFAFVQFVAGCVFVALDVDPSAEFATLMLSGNTALVLILNLFVVQPNTVTNSQAKANEDAAVAVRDAEVLTFLTEAEPPDVEEKVAKKVGATAKKAARRRPQGE